MKDTKEKASKKINEKIILAVVILVIAIVAVCFCILGLGSKKYDGIMKDKNQNLNILMIGNSFSVDASEYLKEVASAAGYNNVVVGNCYVRGKSLAQYWQYVDEKMPVYTYRIKDKKDTKWNVREEVYLKDALKDKKWDIIYFNHYSSMCGMPKTFVNEQGENYLDLLVQYSKKYCKKALIGWEMTWAYPQENDFEEYKGYYNSDQLYMYQCICDTTKEVVVPRVDLVTPVGTTIQNLRSSYMGDTLNRDERHLSLQLGRYAAAMTVAASSGMDISGLEHPNYDLMYASNLHMPLLHSAVAGAVEKPYEVTEQGMWQLPVLDTPVIKMEETDDGDLITWNKVDGVTKYSLVHQDSSTQEEMLDCDIYLIDTQISVPEVVDPTATYYIKAEGDDYIVSTYSQGFTLP